MSWSKGKIRPSRRKHADIAHLPPAEYKAETMRRDSAARQAAIGPARMRKIRYGLTDAEYAALLKKQKQKNRCAICRHEKPLVVDHCHATNVVRGLLCQLCNKALGKFGDDPALLLRALDYLKRTRRIDLCS